MLFYYYIMFKYIYFLILVVDSIVLFLVYLNVEVFFVTDASLPLSALRLIAPPLRLMSASMWKVMQQRDVVHYGKLEEIVTSICDTVPGLLQYRHQARLSMGLQALVG